MGVFFPSVTMGFFLALLIGISYQEDKQMEQFALVRVTGDEIHTLQLFERREDALEARRRYRADPGPLPGSVHVIFGDFDAAGKLDRRSFRLY